MLWLLDASAAVAADRASRECAELRQMLDTVPVPTRRRGPGHTLVACNRAYAKAVDATTDLAVAEGRELVPALGRARTATL